MGVIYKLKSDVKDYIINQKQSDPDLSCRKLAVFIFSKFQLKLSKSSINAVMKEAELSMPVGRRHKAKRGIAEAAGLGVILLKAADSLLGGSLRIADAVRGKIGSKDSDILAKTEYLIYNSLFDLSEKAHMESKLPVWAIINKRFNRADIDSYLIEMQQVKELSADLHRIITELFQEVRCFKLTSASGEAVYLDGQMHSVWPTQNIPYNFSTTLYDANSCVNKTILGEEPLILFTAPGGETPGKEIFDFISKFSSENAFSNLTLVGNRHDDLGIQALENLKKKSFIFGLWPWQFPAFRKAKIADHFTKFYFEPLKKDFYIAEAEISLLQPITNKSFTLKGCALKTSISENIKLVILSSFSANEVKIEDLAGLYLNRWPNLEETYQDFTRKCELFTYSASLRPHFSMHRLDWSIDSAQDLSSLFNYYLHMLDLYVKWQFLPAGYEKRAFSITNEQFYSQKARLKKRKNHLFASFQPPHEYLFSKDLDYACRRINEREVIIDGKRLWCGD